MLSPDVGRDDHVITAYDLCQQHHACDVAALPVELDGTEKGRKLRRGDGIINRFRVEAFGTVEDIGEDANGSRGPCKPDALYRSLRNLIRFGQFTRVQSLKLAGGQNISELARVEGVAGL